MFACLYLLAYLPLLRQAAVDRAKAKDEACDVQVTNQRAEKQKLYAQVRCTTLSTGQHVFMFICSLSYVTASVYVPILSISATSSQLSANLLLEVAEFFPPGWMCSKALGRIYYNIKKKKKAASSGSVSPSSTAKTNSPGYLDR